MKALTIKLTHGRVWTADTSDGKHAQGASLESVLEKLRPLSTGETNPSPIGLEPLKLVFDGIRDSGGDGQIGSGVSAA